MHELAVTESLLELADRHGRAAGARRVTDLYLVLGQLSSIVDESVRFYWPFVSRGTIAQDARLHFRRVAARMRCCACETQFGLSGEHLACPECGSTAIEVLEGDEFRLEAIDIDEEQAQSEAGQ